jgi:hypothetical protein
MNNFAMGEYYLWYCDWCDSTNQTHWGMISRHDLCCAACHQPGSDSAAAGSGRLRHAA